jgi:hypothetical protein
LGRINQENKRWIKIFDFLLTKYKYLMFLNFRIKIQTLIFKEIQMGAELITITVFFRTIHAKVVLRV